MPEHDTIRGGHRVKDTGRKDRTSAGIQTVYHCVDCDETGTFPLIRGGDIGCPARPDSLGRLSVCPGGDRCRTHPDTSTAQWRAYRDSPSAPIESVPHYTCTVDDFAKRASAQYLKFADRVGIRMSVWSAQAFTVGPDGGTVAEFTHDGKSWHVSVDPFGSITAHPGNARD